MQLRVKNSSTWFSCKNCPNIFPLKVLLTLHEKEEHFFTTNTTKNVKLTSTQTSTPTPVNLRKGNRRSRITKTKLRVKCSNNKILAKKSIKIQKEDKMPGLMQPTTNPPHRMDKVDVVCTNFEPNHNNKCLPPLNLIKKVKVTCGHHSSMCQKNGIDITTCSVTLKPMTSPHQEEEIMLMRKNCRKISSSSSSRNEDHNNNNEAYHESSSSCSSQAESETPIIIDLDSSSSSTCSSSSPKFCNNVNNNDPALSSSSSSCDLNSMKEAKAEPCANFLDHVTTCLSGKKRPTYRCNFCGHDLQTVFQVKEHIPLHIDHFGFPCDRPNCPKSFASRYDQLRHQARHLRKEQKGQKMMASILSSSPIPTPTPTPSSLSGVPPTKVTSVPGGSANSQNFDDDDPLKSYLTRYCLCNQIEYGDMVACDRKDCPKEWFHFQCVGLTKAPRGPWRCPPCRRRTKRKRARHY